MTTFNDKQTPFESLRALLDIDADTTGYSAEQRKAEVAAFLVEVDEAVAELEAKFAGRGLRFTEGFRGACPMQAYGWIDGQRFYFRYRNDIASLRVGTVDPVKAQKAYEYDRTVKAKSMVDFVAANRELSDEQQQEMLAVQAAKAVLETNDDIHAFPSAITAYAGFNDIQGNPYAGALNSKEEILTTFIRLVSELEAPEQEGKAS